MGKGEFSQSKSKGQRHYFPFKAKLKRNNFHTWKFESLITISNAFYRAGLSLYCIRSVFSQLRRQKTGESQQLGDATQPARSSGNFIGL